MKVSTTDPLELPVTVAEFADWMGLESSDQLLYPMLVSATQAVIEYLQHDLIAREWIASIDVIPAKGSSEGISGMLKLARSVYLPYGMTAVSGITVEDVALVENDDYEVLIPYGRVDLKSLYRYDITITYNAGFGTSASSVPELIKTGIKMLAAWMYEHRGGCSDSGSSAITVSGTAAIIQPYRIEMI